MNHRLENEPDEEPEEPLTYLDKILARRARRGRHAAGLPSQARRLAALYRWLLFPQRSCLL